MGSLTQISPQRSPLEYGKGLTPQSSFLPPKNSSWFGKCSLGVLITFHGLWMESGHLESWFGDVESSLRRIPLLHLTSLSGSQNLSGPTTGSWHSKASQEGSFWGKPGTDLPRHFFRAVFSCLTQVLWVPGSWARRLLAKHGRNQREGIRK